jgi:serine/threonine protein kinase
MKSLTRSEAQTRFQVIYEIGSGAFARVEKVYDRTMKQVTAMKILNEGEDEASEQREALLLQSLTHPNIVQCLDFFRIEGQLHIAMEFCSNGCLASHKATMDEKLLLAVIRDIASALDYIHKRNLIHFDVKPQNILISSIGEAKLADFGVSRHADSGTARAEGGKPGTVLYMAPELLKGEEATGAADIWALGITAFEMAVGVPIGLTRWKSIDEWIANNDPVFSSNEKPWSSEFTRIMKQMLIVDAKERITAREILDLPEIGGLPPTWLLAGCLIARASEIFWEDS